MLPPHIAIDVAIDLAKVSVLLMTALIGISLMRGQSAAMRHRLLAWAIAGSLAVPVIGFLLPSWKTPALTISAPKKLLLQPVSAALPPGAVSSILVRAEDRFPLYESITAVWALGFLVFGARLVVGLLLRSRLGSPLLDDSYLRLVRQLSPQFRVAQPVQLLFSRRTDAMPVTWGSIHPRILLPADAVSWPEERRRIVLSHELAHIGRSDWAWQMCAEFAVAVYWFLPLSWFAAARLRRESERAADDAVLLSGVAPSSYAGELLEFSRTLTDSSRHARSALAMSRSSHLERRFIEMLNVNTNRNRLSRAAALVTTCAALAVLLPLATLRLPAQERAGKFTGTISDTRSAVIPNATIIMSNAAAGTKDMTTSDAAGKYVFNGLPRGKYEMRILQPGFQVLVEADVVLQSGADLRKDASLLLGGVNERVDVFASGNPPNPARSAPKRIRVGDNMMAVKLVTKVNPAYPPAAKAARIQGSVLLQAEIGFDGSLTALYVMNSQIDPDLARAAVEAVQQWKYKPTLLNGQPTEVTTTITVDFTLLP